MNNIRIKNIYYMLSYTYKSLAENRFASLDVEEFDNMANLCAGILAIGLPMQIKRGLIREYLDNTEEMSSIKGKLEVAQCIKRQSLQMGKAVCSYDEYTENILLNQILKTTAMILIKCDDVKADNKKILKKSLVFLDGVSPINDIKHISWKSIKYNQNNSTYKMLVNICYLVINSLLMSKSEGVYKMREYVDEIHMHKLYEKFVLEYFRKEHPKLRANADAIAWQLGTDFNLYLPAMQTDITLHYQGNTLIIDTKYYANGTPLAMNSQYGNQTLHSGNVYQIFTYVKNVEQKSGGTVAGCLLYAKNENVKDLDLPYNICGNDIMVKTLDLDKNFKQIRDQLDELAKYIYEL